MRPDYDFYEQLLLDVWYDEEYGFTVNQSFHTRKYLAVIKESSNERLIEGLGIPADYTVEGDEYHIYINQPNGKPAYQFQAHSVPHDITLDDCETIIG